VLVGSRLEAEAVAASGEAAAGEVEPISDHRASAAYRKAMAGVYTRRVLQRVRQRLNPGESQ
ncbi:MAG: xanthine dehydrogenase family protein subunit M, partial [Gammaproteobacteria bacterium]